MPVFHGESVWTQLLCISLHSLLCVCLVEGIAASQLFCWRPDGGEGHSGSVVFCLCNFNNICFKIHINMTYKVLIKAQVLSF